MSITKEQISEIVRLALLSVKKLSHLVTVDSVVTIDTTEDGSNEYATLVVSNFDPTEDDVFAANGLSTNITVFRDGDNGMGASFFAVLKSLDVWRQGQIAKGKDGSLKVVGCVAEAETPIYQLTQPSGEVVNRNRIRVAAFHAKNSDGTTAITQAVENRCQYYNDQSRWGEIEQPSEQAATPTDLIGK